MKEADSLTPQARAELLAQAKNLARERFGRPGRAHVLALFERLVWNHGRGLGQEGAATVH